MPSLDDQQREWMKLIGDELKTDDQIQQMAIEIALHLMQSREYTIEIDNAVYYFVAHTDGNKIGMVVSDAAKYSRHGSKYKPYKVSGEIDQEYSLSENYTAVVEAFIRHVTGNIKPEMIER